MDRLNPKDVQLPFGLSPAKHRTKKTTVKTSIPRPTTSRPTPLRHKKDERSDDIVIKSRSSPIKEKRKALVTSKMREFSDGPSDLSACANTEELEPIPMTQMTPIMPSRKARDKRNREKYQRLWEQDMKAGIEEQRIKYGALEELHKAQAEMQRHALSKYADDRSDERRHKEELDRQMYKDRNDERHHRERLEHSMMSHYAADRNDERRFELAKMRIEHVEPLTRANIMARQQSLLEQDAALDRHIRRQEHCNELIQLHQAYRSISKADRLDTVLREFRVQNTDYDDVWLSPPHQELYMMGHKRYTYSHLLLGVTEIIWDEANDNIIINFRNGKQKVIPANHQFWKPEYLAAEIAVIRFFRYIEMKEVEEENTKSCPFCPHCEIS